MEHALTQLPYVIIASVLSVVGFLDLWFCDVGGMAYGKIYSEK